MIFPKHLEIHIVDKEKKPFLFSDIMVFITLFAPRKNNYDLGVLFSNEFGVINIDKNQLTILAEAVLETGLMDYCGYSECSEKVLIEIFDYKDLERLIHGRETWGLVGKEDLLYGSKEKLLERIKACNNNLLEPVRVYSNFDGQDFLKADLITQLKK